MRVNSKDCVKQKQERLSPIFEGRMEMISWTSPSPPLALQVVKKENATEGFLTRKPSQESWNLFRWEKQNIGPLETLMTKIPLCVLRLKEAWEITPRLLHAQRLLSPPPRPPQPHPAPRHPWGQHGGPREQGLLDRDQVFRRLDQIILEADGSDIFSIIFLHHREWYFPLPMEWGQPGATTAAGEILTSTITPDTDRAPGTDFTTVLQKFSKMVQFRKKFFPGHEVIEDK